MVDFDTASRFKLVETAEQVPGFDLITRSPNGPFVDTGLNINKFDTLFTEQNNARVYLAADTIREMAEGAGLFEPLRAELLEAQNVGYQLGYADATKENVGGTISDLATRLGGLASQLGVPVVVEARSTQDAGDDEQPPVFVQDGDDSPRRPARAAKNGGAALSAPRQGNRAARNKRSVGVSAGPGDDSFRI